MICLIFKIKMTISVNKRHRRRGGRPSCMVRLQRPVRWLIRRVYLLVHSRTTKDKNDKSQAFPFAQNNIILLEKEEAIPPQNSKIYDTDDDDIKVKPALLDLPMQIRQSIYNLIEAQDIASLRLTSTTVKEDIESIHGLCLRVHDGRFENEKLLQKFGIARLNIEQLVDDNFSNSRPIPHPHLLKTLIISGLVSRKNLESLFHISCNLVELRIHYQLFNQRIPSGDTLKSVALNGLQILHISSPTTEISGSPSVCQNIQDVLNDIECPNLTLFQFHIVGLTAEILHDYHICAYKFVSKHTFLQKLDVQLRQTGNANPVAVQREDILLRINDWLHKQFKIRELKLNLNTDMQLWYPLMDSQSCLRSLNLQINGQSWNRLVLTLERNAPSLSSLSISGLCSTLQDGVTTLPVDLVLLRNLSALKNLEIQHIDMESRGMESPIVLRTSSLPQTLKYVKLCHLRLQPHQAMFLLVKLPMLETLDLECWSDTEGSLAGYITVVTFLIKFDVTPVKSMMLSDSRRRMENREYEISKMKHALCNQAEITQINTELYSKVHISRYI